MRIRRLTLDEILKDLEILSRKDMEVLSKLVLRRRSPVCYFTRMCSKGIEDSEAARKKLEAERTKKRIEEIKEAKWRKDPFPDESLTEKAVRLYKSDFDRLRQGKPLFEEEKVPKRVDFLIIGGGIIGSAIAYSLKIRAPDSLDVMVAERDPTYTRCSTTLSVGGIRQQFSLPENIMLSLYSAEFMRNIKQHLSVLDEDPPEIQFQPHGYLFLASEAGEEQLLQNYSIQRECGAKIEMLGLKQLALKYPWLNLKGIAAGTHGYENEGWFDPWSMLSAFKKKAWSLGTQFINGEIIGFEMEKVPLSALPHLDHPIQKTNFAYLKDETGEVHEIEFYVAIVAAGPYSGEIASMLDIGKGQGMLKPPLPVEPRKRYVYTFHCENGPGLDMPFVIDPSGTYVRREGFGGAYICGRSPAESEEPDIGNLEVDYNFFDNAIWPVLAERVKAFEAIKVSSAWAGYYDYNTLDQNALFGFHPYYGNIFFATGFSGHGIQMAPGVGRAASELLLDLEFRTIDLSRFSLDRVFQGTPLLESNIL